jgi:small subunit ribosomal protein S16
MLSIKLSRIGKKHQASYRIVLSERRSKLTGIPTEDLGWYNPRSKEAQINAERVKYWMSKGAKVSDTMHNMLITKGILTGKKIAVHKQPKVDPNAKPAAPAEAGKPAVEPARA